jgi:hypothetical protein
MLYTFYAEMANIDIAAPRIGSLRLWFRIIFKREIFNTFSMRLRCQKEKIAPLFATLAPQECKRA